MSLFDPTRPGDRRLPGVYSGTVSDHRDPELRGRVKVTLAWLPGGYTTDWIPVATAMSGAGFGVFFLPEPGDEVLLAFDHGDPGRPLVIASLWGKDRRPPEDNADGHNNRRVIQSRSGHQLVLDDTEGREQVVVKERSGKTSLTLDSTTGDVLLAIGGETLQFSGGAGTITVRSSATLKVELAGLDAALERTGKLAAAQLELTAVNGVSIVCLAGVDINDGALEVR